MWNSALRFLSFELLTVANNNRFLFTRSPEDDYPEITARTPSVLESDGEYNRTMSQETRQPSALNVNR